MVMSNCGSQLTAASHHVTWSHLEDPSTWDWGRIQESSRGSTEWKFEPPGYKFQNRLSKSQVKILKRTLGLTLVDTTLTFSELQVMLAKAANVCNDQPIGI